MDKSNIDGKFYRALGYLDSGLIKESIVELKEVLSFCSP
jgi:hypothetical protein